MNWVLDYLTDQHLPATLANGNAGAVLLVSRLNDLAYASLISWTGPLPRHSSLLEGPGVTFHQDRPTVVDGHPGLAALEHNKADELSQVPWPDA